MKVQVFQSGMNYTNCYIVYDESTRVGFCVDVSDALSQAYFQFIEGNKIRIQYLLLTHGHFDHTQDIRSFTSRFPQAKVVISATDYQNIKNELSVFCPTSDFVKPDMLVSHGDTIGFEDKTIHVIATPGHTSGCVCYQFEDMLFCGDTVFKDSVGRTDMPTGSFFELVKSVQIIKHLKVNRLFPGHMEITDLESECNNNYYFKL